MDHQTDNQAPVGFLGRMSEFLYDHRIAAGIVILAVTVFFTWELRKLDVSTHFVDLYPKNHPYTETYLKYPGFGSLLKISLVVQVKKGTIYNPQTLQKIQEATRLVDLMPGVDHDQVVSIASRKVKHIESTVGGIQSSTLLLGPVPETPEKIEELRQKTRMTAGVMGKLVSMNEDAVLIEATFIERLADYHTIFNGVNSIIKKLEDNNHEVYAAGQPMLTGWVYYYQKEMRMIFGIGIVILILLLVVYGRNLAIILTPVIAGIVNGIWGFGFASLLGYNLDPLIIVVPVLLIARGHSHSIQMCGRYLEMYQAERDKRKASVASLASLFAPGTVGIICDAAGLFIISVAPIPLIEKLAFICGLWSLSLIVTSVVLTFLVNSYLPAPRKVEESILSAGRETGVVNKIFRFLTLFSSNRRWAIGTASVFLLVSIASVWFANHRQLGDVHPGTPILWPTSEYNRSVKRINERFAGFDLLQVVVESDKVDGVKESDAFDLMLRFQRYMEQDPEVGGTLSFADFVPQVNRLFHGGLPKWGLIPWQTEDAGQFANLAMSGAGPEDFDIYVKRDFTAANITVWYKDHRGKTVERALHRAKGYKDVDKDLAKKQLRIRLASGTMGLLGALNETIGRLEPVTVLLISSVIFLVTSFIYRSLMAGLLLVLISNMANFMTGAVMYLMGIGLDVNTLPVAAVGMGIGIDYNIYLMSRMCEEYRVTQDYARLIPRSVVTTGKQIFFTSTSMIGGVIVWYFLSNLRFTADMGLLLSAVMFAHVLLALLFQAAVMRIIQPEFIKTGLLPKKGDFFKTFGRVWLERLIYRRRG